MPTSHPNKLCVKLVSIVLAVAAVAGLFFIPASYPKTVRTAAEDDQSEPRFFTLQHYNIIRQTPASTVYPRRNQSRLSPVRPSVSKDVILRTERDENEDAHSVQISEEQHYAHNDVAADADESKPAGSEVHSGIIAAGRKSVSRNIVEYSPDFTTDKKPVYPLSARRAGQQGTVGVAAYIDGSGKVVNVIAAKSSGVKSLDDAAVAAVRCWSFDRLHLTDKMNVVRTQIVFRLE